MSAARERRRRSPAAARAEAERALEALRALPETAGPVGPWARCFWEGLMCCLEWTAGLAPEGATRQAGARVLDAASGPHRDSSRWEPGGEQ
jgi:hypothetical protein